MDCSFSAVFDRPETPDLRRNFNLNLKDLILSCIQIIDFSVSQGILESLVANEALLCALSPRFVEFDATEACLALLHQHLLHFFFQGFMQGKATDFCRLKAAGICEAFPSSVIG